MAISVSASTIPSLNTQISANHSPKLSTLSSLQFPIHFPRIRISTNKALSSPSRPCFLPRVEAKKETFSSLDDLLENSDRPVLVDFYATWCGPCQFMAPILNEVGAALKDKIRVVKIDTEKYPKIADTYKIEALPTFILFKDGKPHDRFEGALSKDQLIQRIEDSLSVKK
ncbi:hypothetical protein LWI28_025917 [Acer negundo]|uniref:Thioredoxin domain-containing protein n=1 Tax=Acer negundo TaxID=4023 RepID=A0AAD5JW00_ACENE|nr:hypothetical protein LWI28_025917 [Acer negundo]KAK4860498.1 hypothetical protein QYF36_024991 [Acer negundo]